MSPGVRGVLGGSRLWETPALAADRAALLAFVAGPGPLLLEIGFDHGRRLTATAAAHPGWRVLGAEVRKRRVAEARAWAQAHALTNLLPLRIDARALLHALLPSGSVDVVELYFPVPWPEDDPRAERSLLTAPTFADLARVLRPGGALLFATDVPRLAEQADRVAAATGWVRDDDAFAARPPIDALSRREWRCAADNTPIHRRAWRPGQASCSTAGTVGA
jgi:tRNA (guanine-N7-)-methyltransferase